MSVDLFLLCLISSVSSGSTARFCLPHLHFTFGHLLCSHPVYVPCFLDYLSVYSVDIQIFLLWFIHGDAKSLGIFFFFSDYQLTLRWADLVFLRILLSCSPLRYKNHLEAYELYSLLYLPFQGVVERVIWCPSSLVSSLHVSFKFCDRF